ncbi:regulating synaptic membrane exocytosis protein 3 [Platysternon megacephalum]|uniref:Regulating synaptic membrane exocytosis protein 3 n=1 Tax=Platysternon megacephalum TaxID=55544 RepID=A0A4D9F2D2_9SAUR|nr:regulating synaptic membrane exocytosis protein 3 [Platysternon megacephalum]
MTEDNEWMKTIQNENAYLKNQVRLLRENYELRSLLSQHYENSNEGRIVTSHPAPVYPNACSPGQGAPPHGRDIKPPESPSHLHPSLLQEFSYSPLHIANEEATLSSPKAQAEATFKGIPKNPTLFQPTPRERKPILLSSSSWTTRVEKQLPDSIDLSRLKKVCFTDITSPGGDKARLYGMAHQQHGSVLNAPDLLSQPQSSSLGEFVSSNPLSISNKEGAQAQLVFPGYFKTSEPFSPGIPPRKPVPLINSARDIVCEKMSLDSEEMHRKKRVWFSESPGGDELRKPHTYYLNGNDASMKCLDGSMDEKKHRAMMQRYLSLAARLEKMGYNRDVHPVFSEFLINTYGILKQRPDLHSSPLHSSPADLRKIVIDIVPSKFLGDTLLLLNCLCELSKEDSKPLFAW